MASAPAMAFDRPALATIDVGDGAVGVALSGGGPSLVLLHGWTLDHRMWRPQLDALGAHFRLVMPDRRGFGRSTAPPDLTREADDVLRIADALGLDGFALAGLSQGAAVALDVAVRHGARVTAVALAGTPLPGLVPDPDHVPRDALAALARAGSLAPMRAQWLAHPLMAVADPEARALLAQIVGDYDGHDLLAPSALAPFTRDAIAALPMPLLALAGGEESTWRIACARLLAELAPQGRFASLAGAGHMANLAQPAAFNAALLGFFASGATAG